MTTLDLDALHCAVRDGLVVARPHPRIHDFTLYNYTRRAQAERAWSPAVRAARGLVLRRDGTPVARPWPKFFNVGELEETRWDLLPAEVPEVAQKYDGSLIIVFHNGDSWDCCTRGAWASDQAQWVYARLGVFARGLCPGFTYLFELLAPWNRIVVPYSSERLVLLGVVDTVSGEDWSYAQTARFGETLHGGDGGNCPALVESVSYAVRPPPTAKELLDATFRLDGNTAEEGFVARFSSGLRVKFKFGEYVRLHRLLTQFSVRRIWEALRDGREIPTDGPVEWTRWAVSRAAEMREQKEELEREARVWHERLGGERVGAEDAEARKQFALRVHQAVPRDLRSAVFRVLDGQSLDSLWRNVRPHGGDGGGGSTGSGTFTTGREFV